MKLILAFKTLVLVTACGTYATLGWATEHTADTTEAQKVFVNRSAPLYLDHSSNKKPAPEVIKFSPRDFLHIASDGADFVGTRKRVSYSDVQAPFTALKHTV